MDCGAASCSSRASVVRETFFVAAVLAVLLAPFFDAVLPLLNVGARVPVCGLIAQYNETVPSSESNRLPLLMRTILTKRIKMQGFIISDHYGIEFTKFLQDMHGWLASGQVKPVVDLVEGLENAPRAFIGLLSGKNFGKVVVRVAD